ncbi:hypothetical protein H7E67_03955 [Clostridium gasigenes]|uniref:hypothetical protein n=1 Tax=Clostridium gasigenes TaxID=94869 RepID=UPI001623CDB9|nr:hypothetical protein [Clostridium gasigenes]MBB6622577.1 hypothetical protein [Clostridium gasigenes]
MYLRILGKEFTFVTEQVHTIVETDVKIKNDDYNMFFKLQGEGKKFKLKEIIKGAELFDYLEEKEIVTIVQLPSPEERLEILEKMMLEGL